MFTSQRTKAGKETGVGLGWRISKDSLGFEYYHHAGEAVGGRAVLLLYPRRSFVVAILSNLSFARFDEKVALEVAHQFVK